MYYRLLRPEFVRDRGRTVLDRLKVPPDHKFPTVEVVHPMLFAIACAKFSKGRSQRARARSAGMDGAEGSAGNESRAGGLGQKGDKAGLGDESPTEGEQGSDGDAPPESVELKENKCAIDFVSKGETYFEGFVGEDEEDLMRRGGLGYPPCYDSIMTDGYDDYEPSGLCCSDGDGSNDGDSDLGFSGRGTSTAVHGSELSQDGTRAGSAASSANSGVCEKAEDDRTGFDMASEPSPVTSTGRR